MDHSRQVINIMVVMEPVLGKWGEKKLLDNIRKYVGKSRRIVRIFSEDCAVIDPGGKYYELFTVDSLIEGIDLFQPLHHVKGAEVQVECVRIVFAVRKETDCTYRCNAGSVFGQDSLSDSIDDHDLANIR